MNDISMVAVDGTDALAFVIVRPSDDGEHVSVEAASNGLPKPHAAHVLRQVADLWDAEAASESSGR